MVTDWSVAVVGFESAKVRCKDVYDERDGNIHSTHQANRCPYTPMAPPFLNPSAESFWGFRNTIERARTARSAELIEESIECRVHPLRRIVVSCGDLPSQFGDTFEPNSLAGDD